MWNQDGFAFCWISWYVTLNMSRTLSVCLSVYYLNVCLSVCVFLSFSSIPPHPDFTRSFTFQHALFFRFTSNEKKITLKISCQTDVKEMFSSFFANFYWLKENRKNFSILKSQIKIFIVQNCQENLSFNDRNRSSYS